MQLGPVNTPGEQGKLLLQHHLFTLKKKKEYAHRKNISV